MNKNTIQIEDQTQENQPAEWTETPVSSICIECGKDIAPLPQESALCTKCRYHDKKKKPIPEDGEDNPRYEWAKATISLAPLRDMNAPEKIYTVLRSHGMDEGEAVEATHQLEPVIDREAIRIAAAVFGQIVRALNGKPAGAALERALLNKCDESLRGAARRTGVSHVALRKQIRRILERLSAAGLPIEGVSNH